MHPFDIKTKRHINAIRNTHSLTIAKSIFVSGGSTKFAVVEMKVEGESHCTFFKTQISTEEKIWSQKILYVD